MVKNVRTIFKLTFPLNISIHLMAIYSIIVTASQFNLPQFCHLLVRALRVLWGNRSLPRAKFNAGKIQLECKQFAGAVFRCCLINFAQVHKLLSEISRSYISLRFNFLFLQGFLIKLHCVSLPAQRVDFPAKVPFFYFPFLIKPCSNLKGISRTIRSTECTHGYTAKSSNDSHSTHTKCWFNEQDFCYGMLNIGNYVNSVNECRELQGFGFPTEKHSNIAEAHIKNLNIIIQKMRCSRQLNSKNYKFKRNSQRIYSTLFHSRFRVLFKYLILKI